MEEGSIIEWKERLKQESERLTAEQTRLNRFEAAMKQSNQLFSKIENLLNQEKIKSKNTMRAIGLLKVGKRISENVFSDNYKMDLTPPNSSQSQDSTSAVSVEQMEEERLALETELEDLTQTLFDQANRMVSRESCARQELWVSNQILQKQIQEWKWQLETKKIESDSLRQRLRQLSTKHRKTQSSLDSCKTSLELLSTDSLKSRSSGDLFRLKEHEPLVYIDELMFKEFQSFIKEISTAKKEDDILTFAFVKRHVEIDVQDCFPHFKSIKTNQKKNLYSCIVNGMFIIGQSNPKTEKCSGCGLFRYCHFNLTTTDDSAPTFVIDRFCRDRVLCVSEFYRFIFDLQKEHTMPLLLLYSRWIEIRKKLHMSRLRMLAIAEARHMDNVEFVQ